MPVPIVLSWSGGKDSALALSALRADPRYELVALMTSVTREYDRVSIHGVRRALLDAQVQAGAFAGRRFDAALLDNLPASVDPCGERGEFHTFVSAGPIFAAPIAVTVGEVVLRDGRFAYCDLLPGSAA